MPLPKNRSNSVRKIKVRVPSGKSVLHFARRKKGGKHSCAVCGGALQGTSSRPGLSASERKPQRIFGGHLCGGCTRKVVTFAARISDKGMAMADVGQRYRRYVEAVMSRPQ